MKYTGTVSLKKATPQGMDYIATIEGMVNPINISIIGAKDLQPDGKIAVEILGVGEQAEPVKGPAPAAFPTGIRALIDRARGKALR